MMTSEKPINRKIELKGAHNFRDIGGYATSDGQRIDWGKLYRSDNLAKLTARDIKRIEELNIQLIVDLRSEEERLSKPNRLPMNNGIKIKNLEVSGINKNHKGLGKKLFYGKLGSLDLEELLYDSYKGAITDYQNELRQFFELLLNPANYPMVVHCSVGKDRTGIVIALVLLALGVSKKTAMDDYLLSKVYLERWIKRFTRKIRWLSLFRADIIQIKKLCDTRPEYLDTTLNMIDQKYGSTVAFLDALGIDEHKRNQLKKQLCG